MSGHKRLKNGLTPQQNAFTVKVVQQIAKKGKVNGTQAAMEVYDTKKRHVAQNIASENMAIPIIKETIEQALNAAGLSTSEIIGEIGKIAKSTPEKWTADTKLKANIELLKITGAYPSNSNKAKGATIKQKIQHLSYDEAKQEMTILTQEASQFIEEAELQ